MAFNLQIPKELAHLKIDSRGYPVPYFVSWIDGKPEFRFLSVERLDMIIERKVCHICGKKLPNDSFYFVAGPTGLENKISTDAPMHRACAEFSLFACPHLFRQKAERRDNDPLAKSLGEERAKYDPGKPDTLFLVKADKIKVKRDDGRPFIHFRPVSTEKYIYENGTLVKAED